MSASNAAQPKSHKKHDDNHNSDNNYVVHPATTKPFCSHIRVPGRIFSRSRLSSYMQLAGDALCAVPMRHQWRHFLFSRRQLRNTESGSLVLGSEDGRPTLHFSHGAAAVVSADANDRVAASHDIQRFLCLLRRKRKTKNGFFVFDPES